MTGLDHGPPKAPAVVAADVPGLPARLVAFARTLRDDGFDIGPADVIDAMRALAALDLPSERAMRPVLCVLFCRRRDERPRFDEVFDAFWLRAGRRRTVLSNARSTSSHGRGEDRSGAAGPGGQEAPSHRGLARYFDWADDTPSATDDDSATTGPPGSPVGGASRAESATAVDVGQVVDPDERAALMALATRLGARLRHRVSRRRRAASRGREIDLRRSMRGSLGHGGDLLELLRRTRRRPPVSLVVLVDVSGSMDAYSLFFMRFAHALSGAFREAETFIFHTRLVHLGGVFRDADPVRAMQKLALISQGWSGGTRIGDAIATFNHSFAATHCGSRTVVIILSDGFDTGPAAQLAAELATLRRRCRRIIWLNPLLGRASYRPVAAGMAAALRHVDVFAAAHNLDSLMALEDDLVRI